MALTRSEQRGMIRQPRILHKFYIYDPGVTDTLGGLTVMHDKDDKGNIKENTKHVLAVVQQVQYWIDQGLMGEKPVGEISGSGKKLLAQVTRGRSEDNDTEPRRVPRYDKSMQSGHPVFAGQPASAARFAARQAALRGRKAKAKATSPTTAAPKPGSTTQKTPPTPPSRS
jgi:hypothetical protein